MLKRIEKLIKKGYEQPFLKLVDKLENETVLHVDLQKKLDSLGSTPIAEPKIFEALQNKESVMKTDLLLEVLTKEEILTYSTQELGDFVAKVNDKIVPYLNEDGVCKTTPNTENIPLLNVFEAEEFSQLMKKVESVKKDLTSADKLGAEDLKLKVEEFTAISKEAEDLAFKIAKIDLVKLTRWEKTLIFTDIMLGCVNPEKSNVGKR